MYPKRDTIRKATKLITHTGLLAVLKKKFRKGKSRKTFWMVSCGYNHLTWFLWQIKFKKNSNKTNSMQYCLFKAELLLCIWPLLLCTNRNKNVKKFGFSTLQTGQSTVSSDGHLNRTSLGRQSHPRGFVGRKSLGKVIHHVWQDDCDI